MSKIGRWLFELRVKHSLRLMEVADKLGVTKVFLSQVESGSKFLPEKLIPSVAKLFNQSLEWVTERRKLDHDISKVVRAFSNFDLSDKQKVIALARTLDDEGLGENISSLSTHVTSSEDQDL